jgi:tetratricopeptide (TPR) repeat protein
MMDGGNANSMRMTEKKRGRIFWSALTLLGSILGILFHAALDDVILKPILSAFFTPAHEGGERFLARLPKVTERYRQSFDAAAAKPDWSEIAAARIKLRQALAAKRFAYLDSVLSAAQQAFLQNPAQETRLYWLYQIFENLDSSDSLSLDQWVAQQPGRIAPLVARMTFRVQKGWTFRGDEWASETTGAQFADMNRQFELAGQDGLAALKLDARQILPHLAFMAIGTSGAYQDGFEAMENAYAVSPASFYCWRLLVWYQTPRWGGSYSEMEKISDFIEDMAALNPALLQVRGLIANDKAKVLRTKKKTEEAIQVLDRAITCEPNSELHLARARMHMNKQRYHEAMRDLEKAEAITPLVSLVLIRKAKCLLNLGRIKDAMQVYAFAKAQDPYDEDVVEFAGEAVWPLVRLASAETSAKRYDAALHLLDQAIALDPTSSFAYYRRGRNFALKNEMARAVADLDQAIRLKPDFFDAYLLIDAVLASQRDWKTILKYWNAYIAIVPDNDTAYFERSGTHFHAGNLATAKMDIERACKGGHAEACKIYSRKFGGRPTP